MPSGYEDSPDYGGPPPSVPGVTLIALLILLLVVVFWSVFTESAWA